jgi:hypothetical protein
MAGRPKGTGVRPDSIQQRVLRTIQQKAGPITVSNIIGKVGPSISATQAIQRGKQFISAPSRRYAKEQSLEALAMRGRRHIVQQAIFYLMRYGHIRRLARGVYAPPEAKETSDHHLTTIPQAATIDEPDTNPITVDLGNTHDGHIATSIETSGSGV